MYDFHFIFSPFQSPCSRQSEDDAMLKGMNLLCPPVLSSPHHQQYSTAFCPFKNVFGLLLPPTLDSGSATLPPTSRQNHLSEECCWWESFHCVGPHWLNTNWICQFPLSRASEGSASSAIEMEWIMQGNGENPISIVQIEVNLRKSWWYLFVYDSNLKTMSIGGRKWNDDRWLRVDSVVSVSLGWRWTEVPATAAGGRKVIEWIFRSWNEISPLAMD